LRVCQLIIAVTLFVALIACNTQPISVNEATNVPAANQLQFRDAGAATAPVVVTRDVGINGAACAVRILVNDKVAAYLYAGEKVTLNIPAGEVILGADATTGGLCWSRLVELEAKLVAGRASHYRVGYDMNNSIGLFRTVGR
jgi:hypothetical protein